MWQGVQVVSKSFLPSERFCVYLLVSPWVELVSRVRFGRGDLERVLQGQSIGHRRPHLPIQSFEVSDEVVQRGLDRGGPTVARHDDGVGWQERLHLSHRLKGKIVVPFEQPWDSWLLRENCIAGEEYLLLRKPNEQIALCLAQPEDLELDRASSQIDGRVMIDQDIASARFDVLDSNVRAHEVDHEFPVLFKLLIDVALRFRMHDDRCAARE